MKSFGQDKYVPLLLTKRGERSALRECGDTLKSKLRPLFVIHPVEWDWDASAPKKTVTGHLAKLPAELVSAWGNSPAFLDASKVGDELVEGSHPLNWIANTAFDLGLELTPVVGFDSSTDYKTAVAEMIEDGCDVCLRLPPQHWPGGQDDPIDNLLSSLGASARDAHLVLDLGDDVGSSTGRLARDELAVFPHLEDWKSVTFAATAIPSDMPTGPGEHYQARQDWAIYAALRALDPPLPRIPSYGDYTINGDNTGPNIDPKLMNISATLRYATDTQWVIAKGGLYKGNGGRSIGGSAVHAPAALLLNHAQFMAQDHCMFEPWIRDVAAGNGGSSPESWRKLATRHHLSVATDQIANLNASLATP